MHMSRARYYRWDKTTDAIHPASSFMDGWSEDREQARVAKTEIVVPDAWLDTATERTVWVSTVFLSMDHGFSDEGPPIVFETLVFGLPPDHPLRDYMRRYSTAADARRGHAEIVKLVGKAIRETVLKGKRP
jgi:hypothetical protein